MNFKCVSVIVLAIMVVTSIMGESISNSGQGFDLDGNPSIKSSSTDIFEFEDMPAKPEKTPVDGNVYLGTASDDNEGLKKIDVIELSSAWLVLDLNFYKSSKSYKEFEEALDVAYKNAANANLELKSNAKKFLKDKVKEKQSEGDLEQVLIFRNALDTIDQGILGSDPQIVELKNNFAKHNLNIKKDYFRNVIVVASKFNNQLEQQKKELTVGGKIEKAKKIDIFQRKLKKWAQVLAREISTKNDNSINTKEHKNNVINKSQKVTKVQPSLISDKRVLERTKTISIDATNAKGESIGFLKRGDVVSFRYKRGRWSKYNKYIDPESRQIKKEERPCIVKKGQEKILAHIPCSTKVDPFEFYIQEDGEYAIRIDDDIIDDNDGTLTYEVIIYSNIKHIDSSSSGKLKTKQILIDSRSEVGTFIASAKRGDVLTIKYVKGSWSSNMDVKIPDSVDLMHNDKDKAIIIKVEDPKRVLTYIPANTKNQPFKYEVQEDGDYSIRINDDHWGISDNSGLVTYEVSLLRQSDNSSSSSFNANQTSNAKLSIQQKIVSIEASNPANYICSAQPGDIIEISYINGKWAASHSFIAESPNEKNFNRSEHKCRLVKKNDARFVLAEIPHNTNVNPFRYTVTDADGTEFALRMNDELSEDPFRLFNDNIGTVQYSIRVIRKGGSNNASNFFNIESNEDKRVLGKDKSPVIQSSSLQSKRNFSNFNLTGTQEETFITLKKSSNPYIIKEQYRVPSGSELIVEPGVTLIFEKGASLYCEGKVLMNGTKHDPIFLKGKIPASGYWKGLTVKNSNSNLEYIKITDAETGITINEGSPNISFSIFTHCKRGAVAEGGPTFFNCLFSKNEENGVFQNRPASRDGASFELCSFKDNLGWGFDSQYYAKATFTSCLFENNKGGGIKSVLYECEIKAKGCYFKNNHTFDVLNESENTWNFEENYWGPRVTRKLQQKGDGVNLENIKDGKDSGDANIVLIGKFLTKEPDKYGSTVDF